MENGIQKEFDKLATQSEQHISKVWTYSLLLSNKNF